MSESSESVRKEIEQLVKTNPVVLFMKGTKHFPQCGFSATVVEILRRSSTDFHFVNVLENPGIRQGIKDYAGWPTIPQLYIRGEFVGGCDIVRQLYESGELEKLLTTTSGSATSDTATSSS